MDLLKRCLDEWNIDIDDDALILFSKYRDMLLSWNEKMNLTSITNRDEIVIKHFVDSIAILRFIDPSDKMILDVGTGAGFPGIPIKIMCPDSSVVLLDSLNKRIGFLDEVISTLGLTGISTVHSRAEDLAHDDGFRERFDIVSSRAVAQLNILSEYCLPFVNINGYFISYKGANISEELDGSTKAVGLLGGSAEKVESFSLPYSDSERSLIFIKKTAKTPERFPRKAGTPLKKPL